MLVTPIDISAAVGRRDPYVRLCRGPNAVGSTPDIYGPRGEHAEVQGLDIWSASYGPNVGRFASVFQQEWSVWVRPTARLTTADRIEDYQDALDRARFFRQRLLEAN